MATPTGTTTYRLASQVAVRFIGLYLVALALIVFVLTAVLVAVDVTPDIMIIFVFVGLIGLGVFGWWLTKRAYVVKATPDGYEVRMVRSAGVKTGRWTQVEDAVTTSPRGVDCVVLRLSDGGTTTIPVALLAIHKDDFVRELQGHLQRGHLKR